VELSLPALANSVDSLGLVDLIERAKLTEREREVLKLYLGGRSFAEIASGLGIIAATQPSARVRDSLRTVLQRAG
jgi:DNA-binding NarL/FixJ family response regulator